MQVEDADGFWRSNIGGKGLEINSFLFHNAFKLMEKYLALLSLLNLHQRRLNDVKHTSRNFSAHPASQKNGGALASYRQSRPLCRLNLYSTGVPDMC